MRHFLKNFLRFLSRVEDSILVGLLLLMICLAVIQILLRNFFQFGIVWGDILVRILVLWIGLMGAMVATRQNNHISIDVISRYLPIKMKNCVDGIIDLFTALVCAVAAWFSFRFVLLEFEEGGVAFAQVPAWLCESIMPIAFLVISLRYFVLTFINLTKTAKAAK